LFTTKPGARSRRLIVAAAAVLLSVGAVAAAGAAPSKNPAPVTINPLFTNKGADREAKLYACAQQEGAVVFYTSTSNFDKLFSPVFEKRYPGVKVELFNATADLPTKLREEENAGRHNFDVYGDTLGNMPRNSTYFQPIYTPRSGELRSGLSGAYYAGYAGFIMGLGYNPKVLSVGDLPRQWKDLLLPKWTGKIYMGIDSGTAGTIGLLHSLYGEDFIAKLAKQVRVQQTTSRGIADQIEAGIIPLGFIVPVSYHQLDYLGKGLPYRWLPMEAVPGFFQAASISRSARHPCAAALFVDWLLSKEAQPIWDAKGNERPFKGQPLIPFDLKGTSPPFSIPSKWNVYMTASPSFRKGFKNYPEALAFWQDLIRKYFLA
jgi:iron(III) transport system substrate-binding protein